MWYCSRALHSNIGGIYGLAFGFKEFLQRRIVVVREIYVRYTSRAYRARYEEPGSRRLQCLYINHHEVHHYHSTDIAPGP